MDRLEELVRDALSVHAGDAPGGTDLLDSLRARTPRRRYQWAVVATAAAAVVGLIVGLAIALPKSHHAAGPLDTPRLVTPSPQPSPLVPPGMQPVSYHGVEVFVPARWKINAYGCGFQARQDTVIIPEGAAAACLQSPPPGALTVVRMYQFSMQSIAQQEARLATEPVIIDGYPALRGYRVSPWPYFEPKYPLAILYLPAQDVVVMVSSPNKQTALALLNSAHVVKVDARGCVSHVTPFVPPTAAGTSAPMVPGQPTGAVICRYLDNWLFRSAAASNSQLAELVRMLNSPGKDYKDCASDNRNHLVTFFTYQSHRTVTVTTSGFGCNANAYSSTGASMRVDNQLAYLLGSVTF